MYIHKMLLYARIKEKVLGHKSTDVPRNSTSKLQCLMILVSSRGPGRCVHVVEHFSEHAWHASVSAG